MFQQPATRQFRNGQQFDTLLEARIVFSGRTGVYEDGAGPVEPAPVGHRVGDELRPVVKPDVGGYLP